MTALSHLLYIDSTDDVSISLNRMFAVINDFLVTSRSLNVSCDVHEIWKRGCIVKLYRVAAKSSDHESMNASGKVGLLFILSPFLSLFSLNTGFTMSFLLHGAEFVVAVAFFNY